MAEKAEHAADMMRAVTEKDVALKRAREAAAADDSPTAKEKLAKAEKTIEKIHGARVRALNSALQAAKEDDDKTEKQKARDNVEWPTEWYHAYTTEAGQVAARKELLLAAKTHGRTNTDEKAKWITPPSGHHGSNLYASRHAADVDGFGDGPAIFKLQSAERTGDGPTKILLPEGDTLYFSKPDAWTPAAPEGGAEEGEEEAEAEAEAAAAAALRAVWIPGFATLTALAGE